MLRAIVHGEFEFPPIHCYDCKYFRFLIYHLLQNDMPTIECFEHCDKIGVDYIELSDINIQPTKYFTPPIEYLGPL